MNTNHSKIQVTGLYKAFGHKKVLEGVDLDIKQGESLVIIGGSGSGKSVLLKTIIGLVLPDSGNIKVDGVEITTANKAIKEKILHKFGFLFQSGALFDSMSVWQNICFGLMQNSGITKKDAKNIAIEKLAAVGLADHVADLFPAELSGGMQKRVSLARAIAANPEIIFFDEPTTGLDPIMANIINELIVKCSKALGSTTVTITHDMNSVKKIADKVAMIFDGKIIWSGPVDQLENSHNPYVQQFISGEANGPIQIEVGKAA